MRRSRGGGPGIPDLGLFEEFLSLARLHKNYIQHFCTGDLYARDFVSDRSDLGVRDIISLWRRHRRACPDGKINLYLTSPYCFRQCSYCLFFKNIPSCAGDIEVYKDRLIGLAGTMAPLLEELEFENLFFGGGTPSLFSAGQLREICEKVVSRVKLSPGGSRTFECEPSTATRAKLEIAAAAGFNRLSVGVQSLDTRVLKTLNRVSAGAEYLEGRKPSGAYQDYPMVRDFMASAHALGFREINVDLMVGVRGDTRKSFLDGFRRVIALRPTTISVYQIVPNQKYLDDHHGGSKEDFFARSLDFRRGVFGDLVRIASGHGFRSPGLNRFCMEDKMAGSVVFKDRKAAVMPEYALNEIGPEDSFLTLGHSGDSYLPKTAFYQSTPLTEDPARNVFKTALLPGRRAMEFYCLRKLSSYNDICRADFRRLFGRDVLEVFPGEIGQFRKAGCARVLKDRIAFDRTDIKTRFLVSMVFMGRARVLRRINAWLKEREVQLRFREFSYGAFARYSGGRLSFSAVPLPGSRRSPYFEGLLAPVLSGIKPGKDLVSSLELFESALRKLQARLRTRLGVGVTGEHGRRAPFCI